MTIAACYVSPEGIVFGADSTTSFTHGPNGHHYFNHAQKLFEIGEGTTLACVTWGLGGLGPISYRKLLADLGDGLRKCPPSSVEEVAVRWRDMIWAVYQAPQAGDLTTHLARVKQLDAKLPHENSRVDPIERTIAEEEEYFQLINDLSIGFCVGGHVEGDREPRAYEVIFDPVRGRPSPVERGYGCHFWGAPNIQNRLIAGIDPQLFEDILVQENWSVSRNELQTLVESYNLRHGIIPIREAIDFVHSCIDATIKAFKFSSLPQIVGGPIEIAVITADRRFRWVRHKALDTAISEGELR